MSKTTLRMLMHIAAGLACAPGFGWAQADAVKHDPFARPAFLRAPPPTDAPRKIVSLAAVPEPVWQPALIAVIVAGSKSLVNIDGTIVRIGEEINGHRLLEVHEETAIFVKNRKRVTLSLRGMTPTPEAPSSRKDERATVGRPDAPLKLDALSKPDDRGPASNRDERKQEDK